MLETWKGPTRTGGGGIPEWVPQDAQRYLAHTEHGDTIRALARKGGCAPSTVMRQVRKVELKRDDPLVDEALACLSRLAPGPGSPHAAREEGHGPDDSQSRKDVMTKHSPPDRRSPPDDATIAREARRILRRLCESGACLAVARDMDRAVVVRDLPDGRVTRIAVLDRPVAQAMALKDWIVPQARGRVTRYRISAAGRAALRDLLAEDLRRPAGFSEAPAAFPVPACLPGFGPEAGEESETARRLRYSVAESPVMVLSRLRDKGGAAFLSPELVAAAERLREDFELAQMSPQETPDWDRLLAGGARGEVACDPAGSGPEAAAARVAAALADLGPGLGDVALRCCCYLEGMALAEKRMGWSARSGKIVLRIALQRLRTHYEAAGYSNLIG
ncbi:DUF6456 domain-containing protein [Celeribacter indicus]|nr:DUF6456 domain-containing protein [Celeribacter indicus]SDW78017.1 hypothetical protein SAMN05443573_10731 [Celeribacter indicus]